MKTEKLDRLLSALGRPANQAYTEQNSARVQQQQPRATGGEDAVKIDPSMRRAGDSEQSQRQAKVDRLSAQVASGTYKPKSEEIAVALIKELNIG